MKKVVLLGLYALVIGSILLATVHNIIELNKSTIEEFAPSTEELKLKAAQRNRQLRLTEKDIAEICVKLNTQIIELNRLKKTLSIVTVCILLFTLAVLYRFGFKTQRFDGLMLLVLGLSLYSFDFAFYEISGWFEEGHNATIDLRVWILAGAIITPPFLFYLAYKTNQFEIATQLHTQKWISHLAIILTIIGALIGLVIGIGLLATPDLSGNIT